MILNSLAIEDREKVFLFHPSFPISPSAETKLFLNNRRVELNFFNYNYHIFIHNENNDHWFICVVKIMKAEEIQLEISVFNSIDKRRKRSARLRVFKDLEEFYYFAASKCYGKGLPKVTYMKGHQFRRFQTGIYDCGPYCIYHLHAFLVQDGLNSSISLVKNIKNIGYFYRSLLLDPVFSDLRVITYQKIRDILPPIVDDTFDFDESIKIVFDEYLKLKNSNMNRNLTQTGVKDKSASSLDYDETSWFEPGEIVYMK